MQRRVKFSRSPYNPNQVDPRNLFATKADGLRVRETGKQADERAYQERRAAILARGRKG